MEANQLEKQVPLDVFMQALDLAVLLRANEETVSAGIESIEHFKDFCDSQFTTSSNQ